MDMHLFDSLQDPLPQLLRQPSQQAVLLPLMSRLGRFHTDYRLILMDLNYLLRVTRDTN